MENFFKSILMAAVCVSAANVTNAQSAYLTLDAGYAIPTTGYQGSGTYTEYDDHTVETVNRKGVNRGFNFGVHSGYMFTENIGVDLGVNYLLGQKTNPYEYSDNSSGTTMKFAYESKASSLRLTPSLRFAVPLKKTCLYSRLGMGIYMLNTGTTYMKTEYEMVGSLYTEEQEQKTKGSVSYGLSGAIGATYKFEKFSLFGEVAFYQQTYNSKSAEITSYKINGTDAMSTLTEREKKTEYVTRIDDYNVTDDASPAKELVTSTPFSNLSLNVGIQIPF